ncbi:MAG: lysine--tRNA ligase [Deltaproteobacteria bacterium]|jgi:lysyl-tRNA synthetase class 2|nr:lysine--tRNA ligase [Deltaproteobacteria bacterium]
MDKPSSLRDQPARQDNPAPAAPFSQDAFEREESQVLQARLDKARGMAAAGRALYPNTFRPGQKISEVRAEFGELGHDDFEGLEAVRTVAGRLMARRDYGKSVFFDLRDGSGKIQIYARKDRLPEGGYEQVKNYDIGDIVGVSGTPFKTRTGELTLLVSALELVTKNVMPLAEKFHEMQTELRYRRRYLDLIMNERSFGVFQTRSEIVRLVREIMVRHGYLEVETPMLVPLASGANARPFVTRYNSLGMDFYLRVAPELNLKRLLVGGFDRVFEINRNVRNEGMDSDHNPEFTMMEFYRSYADFEDLMDFTEELFSEVALRVLGTLRFAYQGETIDFSGPWARHSLVESLTKLGGVPEEIVSDLGRAREYLKTLGVEMAPGEPLGKCQAKIFDLKVEPGLRNPTFITYYPADISPLARRNDRDPSVTDRFELFIAGSELANAFSELNDPFDQRGRFLSQMEARDKGDQEGMMIDEDYVRALMYGMPPAAGEGVGIDRLVMLLTDSPNISDVLLFPQLKPEVRSGSAGPQSGTDGGK